MAPSIRPDMLRRSLAGFEESVSPADAPAKGSRSLFSARGSGVSPDTGDLTDECDFAWEGNAAPRSGLYRPQWLERRDHMPSPPKLPVGRGRIAQEKS